jgi:hypothetical protein
MREPAKQSSKTRMTRVYYFLITQASGGTQEYMMECMLCGRGVDSQRPIVSRALPGTQLTHNPFTRRTNKLTRAICMHPTGANDTPAVQPVLDERTFNIRAVDLSHMAGGAARVGKGTDLDGASDEEWED